AKEFRRRRVGHSDGGLNERAAPDRLARTRTKPLLQRICHPKRHFRRSATAASGDLFQRVNQASRKNYEYDAQPIAVKKNRSRAAALLILRAGALEIGITTSGPGLSGLSIVRRLKSAFFS